MSRARLRSQGKNTPFLGLELPGEVRYTWWKAGDVCTDLTPIRGLPALQAHPGFIDPTNPSQ